MATDNMGVKKITESLIKEGASPQDIERAGIVDVLALVSASAVYQAKMAELVKDTRKLSDPFYIINGTRREYEPVVRLHDRVSKCFNGDAKELSDLVLAIGKVAQGMVKDNGRV